MRRFLAAALSAACLAGPASAETDFSDLTPTERAILGSEIREVLLSVPELLPPPRTRRAPSAADIYAEEIESDLATIAAHEGALFAPGLPGFGAADAALTVALFTGQDCADCTRAEAELRDLAQRHDLRVTLLDIEEHAALARALGLDMAPSYVFPDRMLRGHIPQIVLERYMAE